ncbi:TniQ family protein [uncultured Ruegeria sp.]|uniref:TniQ family protein n=1 Tax=uncultured Ruegeria sp. TaxID=259304 RepID=UPI002601E152|nr:TniQ family protein [uncultured Ruegeria sp.]
MTVRPLPFRPPPMRDELLSSWMGRLAKANHCSVEELCGYLGIGQGRVPECASDLRTANWAMLCGAVQRSPDEIVSMALPDTMQHDVKYVSRHDFQYCPGCVAKSPDLVLRHWRLAWSMTCEICGQVLAAKYPAKDVSGRLHARALRGAEVLKTAATTTDLARLRRISLTLQVMSVLKIGRLWSLTSGNKRDRLLALAAVGIGTTRPLLGAAIILRGKDLAARELSRVFPEHRQMIERIRGLSQDLGRPLPGLGETGHPTGHETHGLCRPRVSESALQAARQAISELGADANRQALLMRADAIWKRLSEVKS